MTRKMGRKSLSTGALDQRRSRKLKKVNSLPNLTSAELELYEETPFLALPGIGTRVNSFYQNLENQSNELLRGRKLSANRPKKLTTAFEDGVTLNLSICVIQGLLNAVNYGWNASALNVPQEIIISDTNMNDAEFASLNSLFCVGAIFGAFFGGAFSDRFGRKTFLLFNDFLWIGSAVIFYFVEDYPLFVAGRILSGFAGGGSLVVVPTYLGEISPTRVRGLIGSLNQFCICFGILLTSFCARKGWFYEDWRYLLTFTAIPAFIQLLTFWSFPETPPYLIQKDRVKEGRETLQRLRMHDDVEWEVALIARSISKKSTASEPRKPLLVFGEPEAPPAGLAARLFTETPLCRAFLIACALMVAQQLSGINSVFFYSASVFRRARVDAWAGTNIVAFANFLSVFAATSVVEKLGRRMCLQISCVIMALSAVLATVCLYYGGRANAPEFWQYITIFAFVFFVAGFELGLGPIPWLIVAEIIPTKDLSAVMGIASAVNGLSNFCIAQFFFLFQKHLHYLVYLPFAVIISLSFFFVDRCVPETKGLRVEEVQKLLSR